LSRAGRRLAAGRHAPGKEPPIVHERFGAPAAFKGGAPLLEQDFGNMGEMQMGMRSRGFTGACINPLQEATVSRFHQALHPCVDGISLPTQWAAKQIARLWPLC
jgi:hypothetical protein